MQRLQYIDTAKGLAIVSIVLLHFEDGIFFPQLNLFISAYMITMFYITAGWVDAMNVNQRPFKEFLKRRWNQLMIPYMWWTGIILAFDSILWAFKYYDCYFMARELYKSITLRGIGTLWFLPALFGGSLLWHFTKQKNKWGIYLGVLFIVLIYQYLYHRFISINSDHIGRIIDAPFRTINSMGGAWIGIAAGYMFYKLYNEYWRINSISRDLVIGIALCVVSYYLETRTQLPSSLWTISTPLLSPIGFVLICKAWQQNNLIRYVKLFFTYWGKHSMALMVTHYSIVMTICILLNQLIVGDQKLMGWNSLIWFVVAMFIEYYLIILLEKRFPKIFGKKNTKLNRIESSHP